MPSNIVDVWDMRPEVLQKTFAIAYVILWFVRTGVETILSATHGACDGVLQKGAPSGG